MAPAQTSPIGLIGIREMASGSYQLKINYLETMKFRPGSYLKSPTFSVGGFEWMLFYYPRGKRKERSDRGHGHGESAYLYVFLRTIAKNVDAIFDFTLLENNGALSATKTKRVSQAFSHDSFASRDLPSGCWVRFFTQDDAVDKYLLDGHIVIICTVAIMGSDSARLAASSSAVAPCLNLSEDLANLWLDRDMLDVTFEVNGELFQAHKLVLAARSPVFKNILFGPAQQGRSGTVQIEGMLPSVFKMMLQFIYTDSVPDDQELADSDAAAAALLAITQQLLAAADTYALTRLKLMCEERLCRELSIDSFATTLVLAEQHDCPRLKAACLYFASDPENLSKIALTDEYLNLSLTYPSILRELRDKCRAGAGPLNSNHSSN